MRLQVSVRSLCIAAVLACDVAPLDPGEPSPTSSPSTTSDGPTVDSGTSTTTSTVKTDPGVPGCADPSLRSQLGPFQRFTFQTNDPAEEDWTWGTGILVGDYDGDGTAEFWVTGESAIHAFGVDAEKGLVPQASGLPTSVPSLALVGGGSGGAVADYDGDGDLDVYVTRVLGWPRTNHAQAGVNRLFRNDGPKGFTDVTAAAGAVDGCHSTLCFRSNAASFGDIDGDGDLDLFVGNHGPIIPGAPEVGEPAFLYLNNGDGTFQDAHRFLGEEADAGLTLSGGMFDLDRDGALDLYLANDVGGRATPNLILWNRAGNAKAWYVDLDSGLGISLDAMGLAAGDLNGDLIPDFATPGFGIVALMLSNPDLGLWFESSDARKVTLLNAMEVGWGTTFADLDNDGDLDMLTQHGPLRDSGAPYEPDALHLNVGTPSDPMFDLDEVDVFGVADRGNNRGVATVDLDHDGWLDLIKASTDGEVSVLMARCGAAAWLEVVLEQPGTMNRHAVGAEVLVTRGDTTWIRTVRSGGTSFGVGLPPEVHFGLGAHEEVHVEVRWPDGKSTDLGAVATRQRLTITR